MQIAAESRSVLAMCSLISSLLLSTFLVLGKEISECIIYLSCVHWLSAATGALLEQERFVAEVPEAQRSRILQEFFKWSLETNAPFAFVRHVAWKATRLFKLNVRWYAY